MSAEVAKQAVSCIPIAGFKDVYDVSAVEKALQELPPSANEALRSLYEKMMRLGGQRFTVKPSALPAMEKLFDELPNFADVLADIRKRDARDAARDTAPLARAADAALLDTSDLAIDAAVQRAIALVEDRIGAKRERG